MDTTILLMNPNANAAIISAAVEPSYIIAIAQLVIPIFAIFMLIMFLTSICKSSKTKVYREVITDMYVAGTIRKYADEDKVNLDEEYKKFAKWQKRRDLKHKELDEAIESNLKDKVSEKNDKEMASIK